ncbi:hypothetical protein CR513_45626, partial [Mucuna pruriens]
MVPGCPRPICEMARASITPAPLPSWLDAPSTDKNHLLFSSVSGPLAAISVIKSTNAWAFMWPLLS